jgi:hypothetical protein
MRKYEVEIKERSKAIFSIFLKQTIMHPLLVFLAMLFLLLICNPLVCASNDTKIAKFG